MSLLGSYLAGSHLAGSYLGSHRSCPKLLPQQADR